MLLVVQLLLPTPVPRDTPLSIRVEAFFRDSQDNPVNPTQEDIDSFLAYADIVNDKGTLQNFTRTASLESPNFVETFDAPTVAALAQGLLEIPDNAYALITSGYKSTNTGLTSYTITGANSEVLNKTEDTSWATLTPELQFSWSEFFKVQGFPPLSEALWDAEFPKLHNINVNFIAGRDSSKVIYLNEVP